MFSNTSRVIVVDDMASMRKAVSKFCMEIGFTNIVEASDGAIAWQTIQDANPPIDLVISDWDMPNCNGLELCKRLRGNPRFTKLPFLMLTLEADLPKVNENLKAGIDNVLVKPFNAALLKEKLEEIYKARNTTGGKTG